MSGRQTRISEDRFSGVNSSKAPATPASWTSRLTSAFPALRSRNYQLYFTGQFISLVGTWLQVVAQGWLVLKLTNSAFLVGLVAAAATLPMLLFTLLGGVIVDRFPKKRVLLFTQSASMALALALGALTLSNAITVAEIAGLAFLLGMVNAIDAPARQSYVVEMVDRDSLASAIALNSSIFNAARVVGPSAAGLLIATVGTGGTFIINGLTYIAVIIALLLIKARGEPSAQKFESPISAIREGVAYSFAHPVIRPLLVLTAVSSVFGWSFSTMLPVVAQDVFSLDATGLGYLYAATGLGALTATVIVSAFSHRAGPVWFIFGGNALFAAALILFTLTDSLVVALALLFLTGLGILLQFSMMNATIQRLVDDGVRGRVMSIYVLMFIGLSPFGSFEVGLGASYFGPGLAIRLGAAVVFVFGIIFFMGGNGLRLANGAFSGKNRTTDEDFARPMAANTEKT